MDEVKVLVERRADCGDQDAALHGRQLADHIKVNIGISVTVEVTAPAALPRSAGKAARVRDLRPRG
jgi:phenylacetate-CoA ligase